MTELRRTSSIEKNDFFDTMTSSEHGKYVLVYLGLAEVRRFSREEDSPEYLDTLMPQTEGARNMTFTMMRAGGRHDRGALSPEAARTILEEMAPKPSAVAEEFEP